MTMKVETHLTEFMHAVKTRNPGEAEFHQAVEEFVESILPYYLQRSDLRKARILERATEPDRIIIFRVTWEDDDGHIQFNRGWRVQFNNAIGPYKGGLRFHPSVNQSVLKFLGFEQIFKNSLTGLPMGGAKGGSDFDPKGKSDREIMRFCQAFMMELYRHVGEDTDVPAGDIGVGGREIGFLFGQYKRIVNRFVGVLTGKGTPYGGSQIRPEATGYGCVYFCENMLNHVGDTIKGKTCTVSGSGNVAIYTVEKALELGAKVVTMSDSDGFIHDPNGFTHEKLEFVKNLKEVRRGRIAEYTAEYKSATFHPGQRPWGVPCEVAFPSATQNEISGGDAELLLKNGVRAVSEGANMPTNLAGVHGFLRAKILYGPGKAANAGGVSVSGLEQSQNSLRLSWTREEVDARLHGIMNDIHRQCVNHGADQTGHVNYVQGANVAGFIKVANAMLAHGIL